MPAPASAGVNEQRTGGVNHSSGLPMKTRIVLLDAVNFAELAPLRDPSFPHVWEVYQRTATEEVAERIRKADILLTSKVRVDARLLAASRQLRLIAVPGTGVDHIDIASCISAGVGVCNVPDYAVQAVSEHTIAMIFALRRNLIAYREAIRGGRWQDAGRTYFLDYPIGDLAGCTLGIIGAGRIGQAVAGIARALKMTVIFARREGRVEGGVPMTELLERADIISLHCPLSKASHQLIGEWEFARMARRPLLINTSRGALVDEEAMVAALRSGQICGAGFDVASEEPLPNGHPMQRLLELPNFLLTPHIAWASAGARRRLAEDLILNIEAFHAGSPRNLILA